MKIKEIIKESTQLREYSGDITDIVQSLADAAETTEPGTEVHNQVMNLIDNLLAAAKQPAQTPAEQPVTEELSVPDQKKVNALLAAIKNKEEKSRMELLLRDPANVKLILNTIRIAKQEGGQEQIAKEVEYNAQIKNLTTALKNKVLGSMQALNSAYAENSKYGEDVNSEKPKGLPDETALETQIKNAIGGTFQTLHIEYGKNPAEYRKKQQQVVAFMRQASTSGIFTFNDLLSAGTNKQANIFGLIPAQFRDIGEIVGQRLLGLTAGTGAGNWGPGELGLCILGSPVRKAEKKGDLEIGNHAVELKASRDPKSGARLNTDVLLNGGAVKSAYDGIIYELAALVKKQPGDLLEYPVIRKGKVVSTGRYKSLNSFSTQTIGALNLHVFGPLKNPELTLDYLERIVKLVIKPEAHKLVKRATLKQAIDQSTGKIEYTKFIEAYIKILWDCYHKFDNVSAIMVINPVTGNYTISTSSNNLVNSMQLGVVQYSGGIDFGDKQSKASPQIGIA